MNYDKFGIAITFVILFGVCGYAGVVSGEFIDLGIPELSLGESSPEPKTDSYYEWCYKFNIDNC